VVLRLLMMTSSFWASAAMMTGLKFALYALVERGGPKSTSAVGRLNNAAAPKRLGRMRGGKVESSADRSAR
jgi:hypothetical protein